jgi:GNAT superfamily N-acetyltransferase
MNASLRIERFVGADVRRHLDAVAALRIAVFRDWPYLYDGDPAYEREYLDAYALSADSLFVLAFDGDRIVGASTGLPLADDSAEFRAPFDAAGLDASRVFYFGESVLLPAYRGQGVGHAFFDHREAHARGLGRFDLAAFCAVDRDPADPRRPAGHRDNDAFWTGRGYARQPGMTMRLRWNEIDRGDIDHALTFWTRRLEGDEA